MDRKLVFVAAGLAAGTFFAAANAQTMSEGEIAARFSAQRAAIHAVQENPTLGASRGLVLTHIEPEAEALPGATVEAPAPPASAAATGPLVLEAGTAAAGVAETTPGQLQATASAEAAPGGEIPVGAHLTLPKDEQVNVQITFAFDSAVLSDGQKPVLREVCGALDMAGVGVMRIVGHTDASGPAGYNQKLSVLRAEEVQRFFVNDCRVAPERLQAIGVGEQFPYDERDPNAGANRRVEFQAIS